MFSDIRNYCQEYQIPCISTQTEKRLITHLYALQPQYIVEIGSAAGYSSIILAHHAQKR